jgi:hypothetical protein
MTAMTTTHPPSPRRPERHQGPDHDHERDQPGRERRTDTERMHHEPDERRDPPSGDPEGGPPPERPLEPEEGP